MTMDWYNTSRFFLQNTNQAIAYVVLKISYYYQKNILFYCILKIKTCFGSTKQEDVHVSSVLNHHFYANSDTFETQYVKQKKIFL